MRVELEYPCGCSISPFVNLIEEEVDDYDVDMTICDKHRKEILQRAIKESYHLNA